MLDLKNCPFCGAERAHAIPANRKSTERLYPIVRCAGCFTEVPGKNNDFSLDCRSAIAAWNRRALQAVGPEPAVAGVETCKFYHSQWPVEDRLKARGPYGLITDDGEAWRYEYTHSDADGGPYDFVCRPRSALVATPPAETVVEEATRYAERLANVLWEKHYRNAAPNWKPLTGDLIGILTQIDNMTSGLALATEPAVKDDETVAEAAHKALVAGKMLLENSIGCAVNRYGDDYYIHGEPGWLADCRKDLEALEAALAAKDGRS